MTAQLHFHFSLSCIEEGNGNPLQCSCLENPRDWGAWWAANYGVAQSWTRLMWLSSSSSSFKFEPFWLCDLGVCYLTFSNLSFFLCNSITITTTTTTTKSLQSYLTLCDPRDGSPPGSPVPGILQARTLEWVAISFSNAWKWSRSVMSDPQQPHGLQPSRLLHPWDFPGKSTGVGNYYYY